MANLLDIMQLQDVWWRVAYLCHLSNSPTDAICVTARNNGFPYAYTGPWETFTRNVPFSTANGKLQQLGSVVLSATGPSVGWIITLCCDRYCGDEVGVLWYKQKKCTKELNIKAGKRGRFLLRLYPGTPCSIPKKVRQSIAQELCRKGTTTFE